MRNLARAREAIRKQIGDLEKESNIYQSEPWGYSSPHSFYNCTLAVLTHLEALGVLDVLMAIEASMGRIRKGSGYSDRLIDIDLLFYGDLVMEDPRLTLPHPALEKRRFVLEPLHEIAPALVHPRSGLSIRELLARCPDKARLIPVKED